MRAMPMPRQCQGMKQPKVMRLTGSPMEVQHPRLSMQTLSKAGQRRHDTRDPEPSSVRHSCSLMQARQHVLEL